MSSEAPQSPAVDATAAGRLCLSADGTPLGTIVGIYRDPATDAARWAVLETGDDERPHVFVPLQDAVAERDGVHIPYAAGHVRVAPPVRSHTGLEVDEETRLLQHYAMVPPAPIESAADSELPSSIELHAEELVISKLEWRPYSRARIRIVVRTEEVTRTVTVRREELVIDEEPVSPVDRLEMAFGLTERTQQDAVELTLHREEVVVETRVVPYERVRVHVVENLADFEVRGTVGREQLEVERTRPE